MKIKLLLALPAIFALVAPARAEQVTNGNFEVFSGGLPAGWTYTRGSDGPATLESAAAVSPFTGVYAAGTRRLISSALVDTGGGYCSQNVMPVHVATAEAARVDVEVTSMSARGRQITARRGIRVADVAPQHRLRISVP